MAAIDSNFANFTYTPRSLPEDDTSMVSWPFSAWVGVECGKYGCQLDVHKDFQVRQKHQGRLRRFLQR